MGETYGYIRVSSIDQNENRQIDAMLELGIPKANIFIDKKSGKNFDRPGYQKMYRKLKKEDVLYIKSIDRLGRNYSEIQHQWQLIKNKGVYIVVLDMPLLDTRQKADGVTGQFIADLVLQILCYVAHIERENIRQRQKEGIQSAKSRGVRFGRPEVLLPEGFEHAYELWDMGEISAAKAAESINMPRSTFLKKALLKQEEQKEKNYHKR